MVIGQVNIRLIPNHGNYRTKVWRTSEAHLYLGENGGKKWKLPKRMIVEHLVNHSIVIELNDIALIMTDNL